MLSKSHVPGVSLCPFSSLLLFLGNVLCAPLVIVFLSPQKPHFADSLYEALVRIWEVRRQGPNPTELSSAFPSSLPYFCGSLFRTLLNGQSDFFPSQNPVNLGHLFIKCKDTLLTPSLGYVPEPWAPAPLQQDAWLVASHSP